MWKMSNVRLSNGSPPLERVDARLADHTKPPVCRNLFGSVDPEEFRRDYLEQLQEMEKADTEKWNFDFSKNEPLSPGKYEWEEVDGKDLPDFYTRPPHNVKRAPTAGTVDHNGNRSCLLRTPSQESGGGHSENTAAESRSDYRETRAAARKRPSSEDRDSPCQSKRSNNDTEEANHCPDMSRSVEQTPRKSDPKT
ncbi:cyclin-dependent kinase inhibitor 1Ba [Electrophorus electricus]|uniref:Cyclin-dependent kinase inhibitor 1B n=1 Tax=Electrophorus electricus TaxID=8005 RepID=A0A4W4DQC2_ELEEL|nr:cyclin-dependent kinase inhibitor 1Ba [Electrophorus electricus]